MASPLDVTLLSKFSVIFSMLFIFLLVYAGLSTTKILGKSNAVNALLSLVSALLILFVPSLARVINIMVPWFIVILIFIFMILLFFRFMGQSEQDVKDAMAKYKTIGYVIIILSVIVFLGTLGTVYFSGDSGSNSDLVANGDTNEDGTPQIQPGEVGGPPGIDTFWGTFFHPKVLGLIFVMLIAFFALLTIPSNPDEPTTTGGHGGHH